MNIKINLYKSFGRLESRGPIILAQETNGETISPMELNIEFITPYNLNDYIITLSNDTGMKVSFRHSGNLVHIPKEFLITSTFHIGLTLYADGAVAKKWEIEPIIFVEPDTGFQGLSDYEHLKMKCTALEKELNTLRQSYTASIKALVKQIENLLTEAANERKLLDKRIKALEDDPLKI